MGGPLSHSPGATGRPAVIISASSTLPPVAIDVLTASGSRFVGGGVKGDSQSCRLTRWLHCLLVWGCWPTPGKWKSWRRCHVSRHTSYGGTRSGNSSSGGGHSIPWSLLYNLAPRCRGSRLRGSHIPTARSRITTVATKPYSSSHLQQLEQGNHLEAQIMAQPGWQCL